MLKKFAGYLFLSLLSFGLFTGLFHTVAEAQVSALISPRLSENESLPSPTLFAVNTEAIKTPTAAPTQSQPLPTPTVYVAPPPGLAQQKTEPVVVNPAEETVTPTPVVAIPTVTPAPTAIPTLQPTAAVVTDLESLFTKYSSEYSVDKDLLKKIARCESGFNTTSNNSGMYLGMYQFSSLTWVNNRARMGLDTNPDLRSNAEESIRTAAYMISKGGQGAWPNCSK